MKMLNIICIGSFPIRGTICFTAAVVEELIIEHSIISNPAIGSEMGKVSVIVFCCYVLVNIAVFWKPVATRKDNFLGNKP